MQKDGIQPQTVGNDLAHLGAVLSVARPAWGYDIDPMAMPDARRMTVFALFSTRPQEEITRIKWGSIDEARRMVLITDMKNPGQKYGNDVWCLVPEEAWAVMQSMPNVAD